MSKISRIESQQLGFFVNNFWNIVTLLEDKNQVKDFLKDLLTHTEMKMVAKRIHIAKMLLEGYSYTDIKAFVKVTDSTIARISNIIETNIGLRNAIYHLQKVEVEKNNKKMAVGLHMEEKYSSYFLPQKAIHVLDKKIKSNRKRKSVK